MSLILNGKLPSLMKGYPTISDKYNVRGGTLSSTSAVGYFGDVVKIDGDGYFSVVNSTNTLTSADEVAGVILATNVKLVNTYGGGTTAKAETKPNEAFNLLIDGYVALEVSVSGTDGAEPTTAEKKTALSAIKEGTSAKLTTDGLVSTSGTIDMGWKFTGETYLTDDGTPLAEVVVYPKNI